MSKETKRKFGVNRINMSMEQGNLICADCGLRAGLHYGNDCPKHLKPNKELAEWATKKRTSKDMEVEPIDQYQADPNIS